MIRSIPLLLSFLLLALAARPAAAQAIEESFVVLVRADTFAVESFTRHPDRVEGTVAGRAFGRITYTLVLGAGETASQVALRAWLPTDGAEAPARQEARITLRGDTAIAEIIGPGGSRTDRLPTREGAVPYVNPSFLHMEQIARRARALGDAPSVPVFLAAGGQTVDVPVTRPAADSVVLAIPGAEVRAQVGPDGRLLRGTIAAQGLTFERVGRALPTRLTVEPPDYSAPEGAPYTAQEVVVETSAGHRLIGTLTRPAGRGRVPAVVTITGSGAQDRDQAIPTLPGFRPFREIADTLSRRGMAVLRLDDRGTGASTGDFDAATSADFADDIRAAVSYLRARPDIDGRRVALLGHSEGGLIAPMVAATDPRLAAIVLIAGPAQTGREILAFQQRQVVEGSPALRPEARDSAFAAMQRSLAELEQRQPWMRFFLNHDPLETARRVRRTPVLILHGETDLQVTVDQAAALGQAFRAAGNRDVTVRTFPEVNHLLLRDADGNPAGYSLLAERTVVPEVRGAAADWLARRLRAR